MVISWGNLRLLYLLAALILGVTLSGSTFGGIVGLMIAALLEADVKAFVLARWGAEKKPAKAAGSKAAGKTKKAGN